MEIRIKNILGPNNESCFRVEWPCVIGLSRVMPLDGTPLIVMT